MCPGRTTKIWCRRGESNPRPRDYETLALPLSYAGTGPSCYGYSYGGVKPSAVITGLSADAERCEIIRALSPEATAGLSPIKISTKVPLTLACHPPNLEMLGISSLVG